jgi:hypothetical protein
LDLRLETKLKQAQKHSIEITASLALANADQLLLIVWLVLYLSTTI